MDQGKVTALAGAFADVVHEWTTPEQFEEIKKRNRTYGEGICATHDFFDANMAMEDAFRRTFGRNPWLGSDVEEGRCSENDSDVDLAYWNAAWDQAKSGWLS